LIEAKMAEYNHCDVEKKWQKKWEKDKVFKSVEEFDKEKYYCLAMFPYPSGNLHMGHVRNYAIVDIFARFHRMKGKNVLHPIGWDAFGLPAENAAIKNKIHPAKWTKQNIASMRKQLKVLGISYDWSREIVTCAPEYYKWNQWFFIKMWEKGLVFKKAASVNWCPSCKTVLANEQVQSGTCWRCDSCIEQKKLEQWFIKISAYADELLEDHKQLVYWPEQVLSMQKNWINKSFGLEIEFILVGTCKKLKVFTTRPETIFGVTFMVVAPEHEIINEIKFQIENFAEVKKYVFESIRKPAVERFSNREKTGIRLKGINAINPITGKEVPVFMADYVLTGYGTGVIMAVPAHDQRDWEFANKYNIPIIQVIQGDKFVSFDEQSYEGKGILVNSGSFNGIKSTDAFNIISCWFEKRGIGKRTIRFKLKDWLISRQRYWGTPIPIIHCEHCGIVPVPEKSLPVLLPEDIEFISESEFHIKLNENFINVRCPKCGIDAKRETDTMDTFVDSSWYYARYCDAHNDNMPFDSSKANYWLPVNQYVGGIEHACMHLIYSRFWYKVMRDLGIVKYDEPFTSLLTQGMVILDGSAMSKSKGNIVNPGKIIEKYGADTIRLFVLFAAPPCKQIDWVPDGLEGCWRFINRVWRLYDIVTTKSSIIVCEKDKFELIKMMHKTIKKVTEDIDKKSQFNTAISFIMALVNKLYIYKFHLNDGGISLNVYETVILLMYPFTPHLCEEIWERLGHKGYISTCSWPVFDENIINESVIELPVQINGKLKSKIIVPMNATEEEVRKIIELDSKIVSQLKGKKILKFIFIKNKIVTIVFK
jgi:leucyl-tRNA synthetase